MDWQLDRYRRALEHIDLAKRRIREAIAAGDRLEQLRQLTERAWAEMCVRDLWAPGSACREVWARWMRADLARVDRLLALERAA